MMSQVAEALGSNLQGDDVLMTGVSKDTRSIRPGDLYIALNGERFDGHRFIADASRAGASAVVVCESADVSELPQLPQVQVADTRIALGRLAAFWRQRWQEQDNNRKLIGITGSNGKTSIKEMCNKILVDHTHADEVLATTGNLNNDIGMPMMLLELNKQHRFAVIEMGANHVGEIDYLSRIARPDVAIVNNVGPAHLEGFGSMDNIAKAKAEIYNGLSEDGFAVINRDDVYAPFWFDYCENHCAAQNVISFSMQDNQADVFAESLSDGGYRITVAGESAELRMTVPGEHNVMNALAAISVTNCVGVPLSSAVASLSNFSNIKGRLTIISSDSGYRVIDDSYNANPRSVSAAVDVLSGMKQQANHTVLVLGDMAELGEEAQQLHNEIIEKAKSSGITALYATGEFYKDAVSRFGENGFWFNDKKQLADALRDFLSKDDIVLVKGSRSAAMEEVVEQLVTHNKKNKRVG